MDWQLVASSFTIKFMGIFYTAPFSNFLDLTFNLSTNFGTEIYIFLFLYLFELTSDFYKK